MYYLASTTGTKCNVKYSIDTIMKDMVYIQPQHREASVISVNTSYCFLMYFYHIPRPDD